MQGKRHVSEETSLFEHLQQIQRGSEVSNNSNNNRSNVRVDNNLLGGGGTTEDAIEVD